MAAKHPVSILQELMVQQHKGVPVYEITSTSVKALNGFCCVVRADGIIGVGTGTSKQLAKRDAASDALKKLGYSADTINSTVDERLNNNDDEIILTIPINYNAVGELNELAAHKRYSYPLYEDCGFTVQGKFKIKCKLHDYETEGCGSTKKAAKQSAAHFMLKLLEDNKIVSNTSTKPKINKTELLEDDVILLKFQELTLNKSRISSIKPSDQVQILELEYNCDEEKTIAKNQKVPTKDLKQLQSELEALNIIYTVDIMQKNPYLLVLTCQNEHNTTVIESGEDYEAAYIKAIESALKLVRDLEHNNPVVN